MKSIKAPVLITLGDRDAVRLEHAVEMFRLIPNAQYGRVPRRRSLFALDQPRQGAVAEWRHVSRRAHAQDQVTAESLGLLPQGRLQTMAAKPKTIDEYLVALSR